MTGLPLPIYPFIAQPGSGYSAFNDIAGWWRADTFTGASPNIILTDKSGKGKNATQQAGTLTSGTGVNGQAKFTGNSSAYLNIGLSMNNWPITVITIALRANNARCGFFGHQGATGFNTLWYGYEASNSNFIYNTSGSANTTAEAGTIACYTARLGWGNRQTWVNGVLQATHTQSTVVQSAASTTIGTQYRGLNCDWYETLVWNRTLTLSDLDEVNTYINSRYGMSMPLWSSYTPVPLIVVWGQSNASGRGTKSYLTSPYNTVQTNVKIWTNNSDYTLTTGNIWASLDESVFNNMLGDGSLASLYFGYEASLGNAYTSRVGGTVYVFKFSKGGSPLANMGSVYWLPTDNSAAPNNSNKLYSLLQNNWTAALASLQSSGLRPSCIAIVGTQGEQDATDATASSNYQTNLVTFYNTIRPELGLDIGYTKAKVFITRLPNGQTGEPYLSTVQAAQTNAVSSLNNSYLFNTDSYSLSGGVHFGNASLVQLGIDLAALF